MRLTQYGPVRAVLFDLDGTLLDTAADFHHCLQQLATELKLPQPDPRAVNQTVSSGARALLQLLTGQDELAPEFPVHLQRLLSLYAEQIKHSQATLYSGMQELLADLQQRNLPWGIVTNKPEQYTLVLLQQLGLSAECSLVICPEQVRHCKPDPEPLLLASQQLLLPSAHCIYIGDHPRDILAARAAGMFSIAAAYGYLPPEPCISSWGADLTVDSAEEIRNWLFSAAAANS
ncbi:MAG: HAD-IA family hydrolase [Pseudomonadales bacterium]|nr:HAD-IA family hydrolase [Pseudomonadales bacterium]